MSHLHMIELRHEAIYLSLILFVINFKPTTLSSLRRSVSLVGQALALEANCEIASEL